MALLQRSRRLEPAAIRPVPAPSTRGADTPAARTRPDDSGRSRVLPPSVARVAARTRLSAEILAAVLEIEQRAHATLDDMERADALAARLIARRREHVRAATATRGPDLPISA